MCVESEYNIVPEKFIFWKGRENKCHKCQEKYKILFFLSSLDVYKCEKLIWSEWSRNAFFKLGLKRDFANV